MDIMDSDRDLRCLKSVFVCSVRRSTPKSVTWNIPVMKK